MLFLVYVLCELQTLNPNKDGQKNVTPKDGRMVCPKNTSS